MKTSESFNVDKLQDFLSKRKVSFVSEIRGNRSSSIDFALVVNEDRIGHTKEEAHVSPRQMRNLKNLIKETLDLEIEWIVTRSERNATLEAALIQLIENRLPGLVQNVFIPSLSTNPVDVWIIGAQISVGSEDSSTLDALIDEFLHLYGLQSRI